MFVYALCITVDLKMGLFFIGEHVSYMTENDCRDRVVYSVLGKPEVENTPLLTFTHLQFCVCPLLNPCSPCVGGTNRGLQITIYHALIHLDLWRKEGEDVT